MQQVNYQQMKSMIVASWTKLIDGMDELEGQDPFYGDGDYVDRCYTKLLDFIMPFIQISKSKTRCSVASRRAP